MLFRDQAPVFAIIFYYILHRQKARSAETRLTRALKKSTKHVGQPSGRTYIVKTAVKLADVANEVTHKHRHK